MAKLWWLKIYITIRVGFGGGSGGESSSTWDESEERNLYEGLINVFPADYNPTMFTEEESGKLQVLSKLLAVIRELRPAEK